MDKPSIMVTAAILVFLTVLTVPADAGHPIPAAGDALPAIILQPPEKADHKTYLGLSGARPFALAEIQAEVLVIEIFSMYCPHCQREAPTLNEFYRHIETDPRFKGRVKLIGIGAGNSPFEVDFFRQTYAVPFPLFADEEFTIHKQFGQVMTPYFFGSRRQADGSHRIFYSQLGGSKNARAFLKTLLENAGL